MRINIPQNAAELILLAQNILAKHTADGAASPLSGLNMSDMQTKTTLANAKNALAEQKKLDAEMATEERDLALGSEQRYIAGTVMFYIASIRDFLFGKFKGKEHQMGRWGFEVNDSPGSGVRVVLPSNAAALIALAKSVLAKHTADGAGSPLAPFDMADMQTKTNTADTQNSQAKTLERQAEEAIEARNNALGRGQKQNSTTMGTVLFYVISARDILLGIYRGREHNLGDWGYGVDASLPPSPSAGIITITSNQSIISGMPLAIDITGNLAASGGTILATWETGVTNSADLPSGGTIDFQHVYTAIGIKTITITEVTSGVFSTVAALQMPNIKATAITIDGDFSAATNFNFYGNDLPLTNINELLTQINNYGTSGSLINISGGTMPVPDPNFPPLLALRSRGWMVTTN